MAREDLHFRLRIPEELKNKIADHAAINERSMTAEIVDRLEKSFSRWPELDLDREMVAQAMRLPAGAVDALGWEIESEARRLIQKQLIEHETSRHAMMRVMYEAIDKEPEEDRPKLREQMRRILARSGLGSLDGDDDDLWVDE